MVAIPLSLEHTVKKVLLSGVIPEVIETVVFVPSTRPPCKLAVFSKLRLKGQY